MNRSFFKMILAIFCLIALCTASPGALFQDAKLFIGTWNGSIDVMGQSLEIIVKFSLDEGENLQGTIDIPAQSAKGLALTNFELEGKKITFAIDGVPGEPTFKGELDEAGKKISGEFSQGGVTGSFTLEKE
jgi:hypothetical protein